MTHGTLSACQPCLNCRPFYIEVNEEEIGIRQFNWFLSCPVFSRYKFKRGHVIRVTCRAWLVLFPREKYRVLWKFFLLYHYYYITFPSYKVPPSHYGLLAAFRIKCSLSAFFVQACPGVRIKHFVNAIVKHVLFVSRNISEQTLNSPSPSSSFYRFRL